jgi:hypothetical protein
MQGDVQRKKSSAHVNATQRDHEEAWMHVRTTRWTEYNGAVRCPKDPAARAAER